MKGEELVDLVANVSSVQFDIVPPFYFRLNFSEWRSIEWSVRSRRLSGILPSIREIKNL